MIDSLLEELPQNSRSGERQRNGKSDTITEPSEHSFLAALPIVRRIVARRYSQIDPANGADLVQEVALRLWRWRSKHADKSNDMSGDDWDAFAARTAYNEVNRELARTRRPANLPLEAIVADEEPSIDEHPDLEVFSLIQQVWQAICEMSLRQRRSLLLHSQELIIYFLQIGITERDLADALDLSEADWNSARDRIPMSDLDIAARFEATPGSIKKARYEARVKLEDSIQR